MNFYTTLNMHKNIFGKIREAVSITNFNRNDLIVLLLKHAMNDYRKLARSGCPVKYQKSALPSNWKRVHIVFSDDEYNFCLDMRKFFRMSVSLILAYAVERHLNKIIEKLIVKSTSKNLNSDNYLFYKYIFKQKSQKRIVTWIQKWERPS